MKSKQENEMQDRFLTRYFDKVTQTIYTLKPIENTCENGKDIVFYGILVSGIGQISEYDLDNVYSSRFIKMQCTGLKDKNGKLIFEGDIVKVFHVSSTMQTSIFIGVVKYCQQQAYWRIENDSSWECFFDRDDTFEVLGNIYENKEILTESEK